MAFGSSDSAPLPAYFDPELSHERRIDALLEAMTLDEKLDALGTNPSVPRLGVRGTGHVEGLHGLTLGGPGRWGRDQPVATTTFPQSIGLGMTWDPDALRQVGRIEAYEMRYLFQSPKYQRGALVARAPNADLGRDPRWGRTEECYGEDAYLTGTLATAFVQGLQGDHPTYFMAASLLKHFLANSNEDTRESSSSDFDERLFREYYSVPFRMAIEEGGARAFMTAYNKYNGTPCATHPVVEQVAVREWHQDGIVCTDGGAYQFLVTAHRHYATLPEAAAACVRAGISQFLDDYRDGLRQALDQGLLQERELDYVLRKNFRVMLKLGLWDPPERVPYAQIGYDAQEPWNRPEHQQAVRSVTQKSIVLLKNEPTLLPLDPETVKSIALIGPLADRVLGDWYGGTPPYAVSCADGLRERVGNKRLWVVANNDVSEAILAAKYCQVAIVCVGNHPTGDDYWARVARPSYGKEAVDRKSLTLEDESLVRQVLAHNPNTVLLLMSSFPYAIDWSYSQVPAIVHVAHSSQELGRAVADVLFGDVNPGGRLVQTWPRSLEDLPPLEDYDLRHGHTYQYASVQPLFPFGYGKSYTRFTYSRMLPTSELLSLEQPLTVQVNVTNIGHCAGDEVVQLYARYEQSAVLRPKRQLVGFQRITLEAGETKTVTLTVRPGQLCVWQERQKAFVLESGSLLLEICRDADTVELACRVAARGEPLA